MKTSSCIWTLEDILSLIDQELESEAILNLASLPEGSDSIRHALEMASARELRILTRGLFNHFTVICCGRDGHRIILDLFVLLSETGRLSLVAKATEEVGRLSCSPYGCIVLQRLLQAANLSEDSYEKLARRLQEHRLDLEACRNGREVINLARTHCILCDMRPIVTR